MCRLFEIVIFFCEESIFRGFRIMRRGILVRVGLICICMEILRENAFYLGSLNRLSFF